MLVCPFLVRHECAAVLQLIAFMYPLQLQREVALLQQQVARIDRDRAALERQLARQDTASSDGQRAADEVIDYSLTKLLTK